MTSPSLFLAAAFCAPALINTGVSEESRSLSQTLQATLDPQSSLAIDPVLSKLRSIASDADNAEHGSEAARPVAGSTIRYTYALLGSVPTSTPTPMITALDDGDLMLEWWRDNAWCVIASIDEYGNLHFAAQLGPSRFKGRQHVDDGGTGFYTALQTFVSALTVG